MVDVLVACATGADIVLLSAQAAEVATTSDCIITATLSRLRMRDVAPAAPLTFARRDACPRRWKQSVMSGVTAVCGDGSTPLVPSASVTANNREDGLPRCALTTELSTVGGSKNKASGRTASTDAFKDVVSGVGIGRVPSFSGICMVAPQRTSPGKRNEEKMSKIVKTNRSASFLLSSFFSLFRFVVSQLSVSLIVNRKPGQ